MKKREFVCNGETTLLRRLVRGLIFGFAVLNAAGLAIAGFFSKSGFQSLADSSKSIAGPFEAWTIALREMIGEFITKLRQLF